MSETLSVTSPVVTLHLAGSYLLAGSEDGTLRVYDTQTLKVAKALRLSSEISSAVSLQPNGTSIPDIWVARDRQLLLYAMDVPQLILSEKDAIIKLDVAEGDDLLNELSLSTNFAYLAFSLDSGRVGVVDLSTRQMSLMKSKHEGICGTVKFIPNRPRELVSAGYDETILHFDFMQGVVLSRVKMPAKESLGEMNFSPPFIMCTAISPEGVLAAGTADGRLWIGFGGVKGADSSKKKARKWGGLNEEKSRCITVAEGPIVAITFYKSTLIYSTLLGTVKQCALHPDVQDTISIQRTSSTSAATKVNSIVASESRVYVAGITKGGKGAIEAQENHVSVE